MEGRAVIQSDLAGTLPLVARGKVRDLYELDSKTLLFVATDRISAFDVVMKNGVEGKGALLTQLSIFWFNHLSKAIPDLRTHFVSSDIPSNIPEEFHSQLRSRMMQVRKLKVFPIEAIVRGYVTGSAWKEYQKSGTVHGIKIQPGLQESEAFHAGAIYTPSTKAEAGQHDENIHPNEAGKLVGDKYDKRIADLALKLYNTASAYALERGIIIADTKFEFGLDEETDEVVLVDEVLTPDSSRFWPAASYKVGKSQDSFDKQYLRDWLVSNGSKGKEGTEMPEDVIHNTKAKYEEAYEKLVGKKWSRA